MKNRLFAIGIPTINCAELLNHALKKYIVDFPDTAIVIIDNGNQEIFEHENILIYKQEKNLGVAGSWNLICKIIFQELGLDFAWIINDDVYSGLNLEKIRNLMSDYSYQVSEGLLGCEGSCFTSFIISNKTFNEIGEFDNNFYPAYFEDNDYFYRLKLSGKAVLEVPELIPIVFNKSKTIEKNPDLNKNFDENKKKYEAKWGGLPHHEKYEKQFNGKVLNVITPTIRTDNLQEIYNNLLFNAKNLTIIWWVIFDKSIEEEYSHWVKWFNNKNEGIKNLIVFPFLSNKEKAIAGHAHRNVVLDILEQTKDFNNISEQWIYNLDDDNILHPSFISLLLSGKIDFYDVVIFSQTHGKILRLKADENNVEVCHVDTAMILFKLKALNEIRFIESDYCADGHFIKAIWNNNENRKIIEEPCCYYNYLKGTLTKCPVPLLQNEWEFNKLLDFYNQLNPRKILEIGSFYGGTLWHWIRNSNRLNTVICVDYPIPPSDDRYTEMIDSRAKWKNWFTSDIKFYDIKGDSTHYTTIKQVDEILPHKDLDFLFIDGGHDYFTVKNDFENYYPFVRTGGMIVFHDCVGLEEVRRFWQEIRYLYKSIEIYGNDGGWGLGVIWKP